MSLTPLSLDPGALLGFYQSRYAGAPASTAAAKAPSPPWDVTTTSKPVQAGELVRQALAGHRFVAEDAAQLDVKGASVDYRKLFTAYSALNRLGALAERAGTAGVSTLELGQLSRAFTKGLKETQGYLSGLDLDALRLVQGATATKATTASFSTGRTEYVSKPLVSGSRTTPSAAFDGPIVFDMRVTAINGAPTDIHFDLDDIGTGSRSITDVVLYLNDQLATAGVTTRFGIERTAGVPVTKTINGKTVTLSTPPDQFGLKLVGGTGEAVSLSAPTTAPAVYVGQTVGRADPKSTGDPTQRQLLKFQADGVGGAVLDPAARPGDANRTDERVFASTLGAEVGAIKAQQVGPDGSLYVLSEVTGETGGQAIKGARDVVLTKYDSAGGVVFTRTLGAASEANGYSLAVNADGKVAIAGSVKGALNSGEINIDPTKSDSFVTLYDASGDEMWTYRNGAREDDEARAVAFAADGSVIVAGRSKSAMPGATGNAGGWDGYVQTLATSAKGLPVRTSSQTFGGAGGETVAGMAVNGSQLVIAGTDGPDAVVRSFDLSGGSPALTATRNLGALNGGGVAGVAFDGADVIVAGTTSAALNPGTAANALQGGRDGFVARLSNALTPAAGDAIAYYGGAGEETITGVSVAGGKVYIAGSTTSDLPAGSATGTRQGFLASFDPVTGASDWSQRYAGKDGVAAPSALAVGATGASALDRLGLPSGAIAFAGAKNPVTGKIDLTGSTMKVVAQTSARAGDQFYVQVNGGVRKAVTLEAGDTFSTLTTKINRALGFYGTATVKRDVVGSKDDKDILGNSSRLQIVSRNDDTRITLSAGAANRNLLEALGLSEGEVRTLPPGVTETELVAQGETRTYGLGLSSDLSLASKAEIKRASDQLQAALGVIRGAYRDMKTAAEPKAASTGQAPAYLTAQIANYQAALSRLGG